LSLGAAEIIPGQRDMPKDGLYASFLGGPGFWAFDTRFT